MSKKAFTLIELLAVIVILAIMLVIAVPQILGVIEKVRTNAYKLNSDLMKKAAETYVESGQVNIVGNTATVTLDDLVEKKYISPIKDAKDKSTECIGYVEVEINGKDTTYTPYLKCGDNFASEGFSEEVLSGGEPENPVYVNANIHNAAVPNGYIGIYTIEDLSNMKNNLSGQYILMNNLDFNSDSSYANSANKTTYTTGTGWTPIGNSTTYFTGKFDGNNYKINNLYINNSTLTRCGLFGVSSGTINSIGIENVKITCDSRIGGLVGSLEKGTIKNSYTTGTVTGDSRVGGLVGNNYDTSLIENSYTTVSVTGRDSIGGIAGFMYNSTFKNSYSANSINGQTTVGTISGYISGGTFTNCYRDKNTTITGGTNNPTYSTEYSANFIKSEIFTNYILGWDVQSIWDVSANDYPKLGGTTNVTNGVAVYNIDTIEDLFSIRKDLVGTYTLTKDLDFNNDSSYQIPNNKLALTSGDGWLPIGDGNIQFTGSLNGNNHKISNLYINRVGFNRTGLIGYGNTNALVEKLGLENVNIVGGDRTAAVIGSAYFVTIRNVYVNGSITGGQFTGGLVGLTSGTATEKSNISNSYSTATISGTTDVGGLAGIPQYINVTNCYATGNVTASGSLVGGLFGENGTGLTSTNNYRNINATLIGTSQNTLGTTAVIAEFQSQMFIKYTMGWDLTNIWNSIDNQYPKLGGTSGNTVEIQYNITKLDDLYMMRYDLDGNYTLMNNLDFNNNNDYRNISLKNAWTTNEGWLPIGDTNFKFTGTFNGNNHKINHLYINRTSMSRVGLFGYMDTSNGLIEKLGLENVNIVGGDRTAALVGSLYLGTIRNTYVTGTVTSGQYTGGLVGLSNGVSGTPANILNSYSTATVSGTTDVGGLVGIPQYINITNCYATGNVIASSSMVGGLFGESGTGLTITNSYRNSGATITGSTPNALGTAETVSNLQALTPTGLNTWDKTTIWQVNSGAYPTLR